MLDTKLLIDILEEYSFDTTTCSIETLHSGLINNTWKVKTLDRQFILQRVNHHVFKNPRQIAENIQLISEHVQQVNPEYLFVAPLFTTSNSTLVYKETVGYFRLFPYIPDSYTLTVVKSTDEAYEAALQFGRFTYNLSTFDVSRLHLTLPDFHNLSFRYNQFEAAIKNGEPARAKHAATSIKEVSDRFFLVKQFEAIKKSNGIKQRVMHHDTKISNVLFDENNKGLCVIDLDTIMPGFFISDLGDMMRTYLPTASEEEKDLEKVDIRVEVFQAIVEGYLAYMSNDLTKEEKTLILYAGSFMTYMQAMRFLTDYLLGDKYYTTNYKEHNLVRATNQLQLLKIMEKQRDILQKSISSLIR